MFFDKDVQVYEQLSHGSNHCAFVRFSSGSSGNGERRSHPSGLKAPNELGLYDMTGNLWEFCHDEARMVPYSGEARTNPLEGSFEKPYTVKPKITRGGGYEFEEDESFVYRRDGATPNVRLPDVGFRLVLVDERPMAAGDRRY